MDGWPDMNAVTDPELIGHYLEGYGITVYSSTGTPYGTLEKELDMCRSIASEELGAGMLRAAHYWIGRWVGVRQLIRERGRRGG